LIAIICFTDKGKSLADSIAEKLVSLEFESSVSYAKKLGQEKYVKLDEWVCKNFKKDNFLLFIGACGIAVRAIAPYVKNKVLDPAVAVMDENAQFVISLLSGHLGGANDFVRRLSKITGAAPVITTATDINNLFSVDSFAKQNHMEISNMILAKEFSANLLESKKCNIIIPEEIFDCVKIIGNVPKEIVISKDNNQTINVPQFTVSPFKKKNCENILNLVPKSLVLGVGCRRGKSNAELKDFIRKELDSISAYMNSVVAVCSIDIKKNEPALISFSKDFSLDLKFFSAEQLNAVQGEFSASSFVKEVTGVDNVCERCLFAYGVKKIILNKTKSDGMTLAIGCLEIPVQFDSRMI